MLQCHHTRDSVSTNMSAQPLQVFNCISTGEALWSTHISQLELVLEDFSGFSLSLSESLARIDAYNHTDPFYTDQRSSSS